MQKYYLLPVTQFAVLNHQQVEDFLLLVKKGLLELKQRLFSGTQILGHR